MLIFLYIVLTAFALFLLVATLVFFVEVAAGCLLPSREIEMTVAQRDTRVAVLIPAHNEGAGIKPTIDDVKRQLRPGDRLLIVADNCTDETASIAAASGAEVSVREDQTRIGKGYALAWGIRHLAAEPPDIVIVIDADCRVSSYNEKTVPTMLHIRAPGSRVLFDGCRSPPVNQQVAQFVWLVRNQGSPAWASQVQSAVPLMGSSVGLALLKFLNLHA